VKQVSSLIDNGDAYIPFVLPRFHLASGYDLLSICSGQARFIAHTISFFSERFNLKWQLKRQTFENLNSSECLPGIRIPGTPISRLAGNETPFRRMAFPAKAD
jgi:hypothetical protein